MAITDIQKKEIDNLPANFYEMAIKKHQRKLSDVSDEALEALHKDLPEATIDQKTKIYDTTRRHFNTIAGLDNEKSAQNTIIIMPPELIQDYQEEANRVAAQIKHKKIIDINPKEVTILKNQSSSTKDKKK